MLKRRENVGGVGGKGGDDLGGEEVGIGVCMGWNGGGLWGGLINGGEYVGE